MTFSDATVREAERLVRRYPVARSALLPLLHLVQSVEGYVSAEGIALCARLLSLTKAEVEAVSTFYTMYKREPFGDYLLSVCTNPTCQIAGGQKILEAYEEANGGAVNTEGAGVMVEEAECLGICDAAPVVQINYENYKAESVDDALELLQKARAGEPPASNLSNHVPGTFREVERELSGIDDGTDEYLIEAARLQAAATVAPTYRTGETDIPVTHPGGDPSGHGGDLFRSEANIGLSPLQEPRDRATAEDREVAEELSDELSGEAKQLAEHVTGQDAPAAPTVDEQPALTDDQVSVATGETGARAPSPRTDAADDVDDRDETVVSGDAAAGGSDDETIGRADDDAVDEEA